VVVVAVTTPTMNQAIYPDGSRIQPATKEHSDMSKTDKSKIELLRRALNNHDMVENSLFIKVKESTLYDLEPSYRTVLGHIAFAGGNGVKKPEGTQYEDYKGWCWASQETLALWSGYSERQVQRILDRLEADFVIETREWRDAGGHPRREYKVIESVVDDAQRTGTEERKRKTNRTYKPNKGSFQKKSAAKSVVTPHDISAATHATSQPQPTRHLSQSHTTSQTFPTAEIAVKGVDLSSYEVRDVSPSSSPSPFGVPDSLKPLASREEKSKVKTNGASGLKAETTPTPKPSGRFQMFVDEDEPVPVVADKGFHVEDAD
jgi:hypothetical protein